MANQMLAESVVRAPMHAVATWIGDPPRFRERVRRVLNIVVAVLGLALSVPLLAAIAVLIRVTSGGPVFYSQARVGVDRRRRRQERGGRRRHDCGGRPFQILKFRTMSGSDGGQRWAAAHDPRVTPVGRVLRQLRLDEIPQLVNVLRGEMNVVGPRPEQPQIFATLRRQIANYPVRQRVLPGITGWAQVRLPYDSTIADVRRKVALDIEYLGRVGPAEDLRIMLRTVGVMLGQRGAR